MAYTMDYPYRVTLSMAYTTDYPLPLITEYMTVTGGKMCLRVVTDGDILVHGSHSSARYCSHANMDSTNDGTDDITKRLYKLS